jgi:hypothetical protein
MNLFSTLCMRLLSSALACLPATPGELYSLQVCSQPGPPQPDCRGAKPGRIRREKRSLSEAEEYGDISGWSRCSARTATAKQPLPDKLAYASQPVDNEQACPRCFVSMFEGSTAQFLLELRELLFQFVQFQAQRCDFFFHLRDLIVPGLRLLN